LHPAVVVPSGFAEGAPASSLSFIGQLFDEESPLLLARAFEAATDYHQRHPPSFLDV
jgi:Asp-tRNA(Asn)/Glu-tRNA(Gln) amidotransferase A subunit family amidase